MIYIYIYIYDMILVYVANGKTFLRSLCMTATLSVVVHFTITLQVTTVIIFSTRINMKFGRNIVHVQLLCAIRSAFLNESIICTNDVTKFGSFLLPMLL